jgi:hypothetical protein
MPSVGGVLSDDPHRDRRGSPPGSKEAAIVILGIGLVVGIVLLILAGRAMSRSRTIPPPVRPAGRAPPRPPSTPSIGSTIRRYGPPPRAIGPGRYEWERRTTQAYRRWKNVPAPREDRDAMRAFVTSHRGVEAYVEPRTVMHPLSVVFVDDVGAWTRFELADDAFLRELVLQHPMPVFDAGLVGYPKRMHHDRDDRP